MVVVKANAYGHGLTHIAKALFVEGCRLFAVTDANEGLSLRKHLPQNADIILLSGIFDALDAQCCVTHRLTPVVTSTSHVKHLQQAGFQGSVWLKVDTGMHRLGAINAFGLHQHIQDANIHLAGVMSHLACADTPKHPLNQQQIHRFQAICKQIPAPAYSLFNSAGLIAFSASHHFNVARPGIALYGIEPIPSQPLELKPVAELSSQVIHIHKVKQGESVSYGASWVAPQDMRIAVVAMGYADGLPRLLSNQGKAWVHGCLLPIVGRVCMDYCMLAVGSSKVQEGDKVVFFGGKENQPLANHIATQCQTIAYEIFTHLDKRLLRTYVGEST